MQKIMSVRTIGILLLCISILLLGERSEAKGTTEVRLLLKKRDKEVSNGDLTWKQTNLSLTIASEIPKASKVLGITSKSVASAEILKEAQRLYEAEKEGYTYHLVYSEKGNYTFDTLPEQKDAQESRVTEFYNGNTLVIKYPKLKLTELQTEQRRSFNEEYSLTDGISFVPNIVIGSGLSSLDNLQVVRLSDSLYRVMGISNRGSRVNAVIDESRGFAVNSAQETRNGRLLVEWNGTNFKQFDGVWIATDCIERHFDINNKVFVTYHFKIENARFDVIDKELSRDLLTASVILSGEQSRVIDSREKYPIEYTKLKKSDDFRLLSQRTKSKNVEAERMDADRKSQYLRLEKERQRIKTIAIIKIATYTVMGLATLGFCVVGIKRLIVRLGRNSVDGT